MITRTRLNVTLYVHCLSCNALKKGHISCKLDEMSSTFEVLCGQNMKGLLENNSLCDFGFSRYTDDRDYDLVGSDAVQFGKEMPTRRRNLNTG